MNTLHNALLAIHIAIGTVAVVAFWLPVLARKGGPLHVQAGRVYVWAMYAVSATALAMSAAVLVDPIGVRFPDRNLPLDQALAVANGNRMFALFLFMLGLLVLSSLRHGMLALRARRGDAALRTPGHRALLAALGVAGVAVGLVGLANGQLLLMIFAVLSISGSAGMLRDSLRESLTPREGLVAHLRGLIGTGVGAYTALFAFGGREFLSNLLTGQWQVVPWVAPAIIGTLAISRLKRRYGERQTAALRRQGSTA